MTNIAISFSAHGAGNISDFLRRLFKTPFGAAGAVIVVVMVLAGALAPLLAPYDPNVISIAERLAKPSWAHWLGTDHLGRDNLSRMLFGTRVALGVAFSSIALSVVVGLALGLVVGYGPRWLDQIAILFFDTIRSFPTIMFGIAVVALMGPSLLTIVLIIVVTTFPVYARVVRTQTQAICSNEFILAERSVGLGTFKILLRHILPNLIGPIIILASMDVPLVVTIEAGLSFLGLGIRPPNASWGTILNDGYAFIRNTPWTVVAGGVPLVLTTLGFTFLGESLRDVIDPKLRKDL